MAKKRADPAVSLMRLDPEVETQLAEGRRRAYLEANEEVALHERARADLHYLKAQAVDTLDKAMMNVAWCPSCKTQGLTVDKTAVAAALGVLDRAGFPPIKGLLIESRVAPQGDQDLHDRAVQALKVLDPDDVGMIVARLIEVRPEVREPIERACAGTLLIEAAR